MLPLLLIAADAPALAPGAQAAVDGAVRAERLYATDVQQEGQWDTFRAYAAPRAITFAPQPTIVERALKLPDEPGVPVMWWPATVFPACDGAMAVNTGPWVLAGPGAFGSFTTIWAKQPNGRWRWQIDHGRETPKLIPAGDKPRAISPDCTGVDNGNAGGRQLAFTLLMDRIAEVAETGITSSMFDPLLAEDLIVQRDGEMPAHDVKALPAATYGDRIGTGHDRQWTLVWESFATSTGGHDLRVWQWRGPTQGWRLALYELAEAKAP